MPPAPHVLTRVRTGVFLLGLLDNRRQVGCLAAGRSIDSRKHLADDERRQTELPARALCTTFGVTGRVSRATSRASGRDEEQHTGTSIAAAPGRALGIGASAEGGRPPRGGCGPAISSEPIEARRGLGAASRASELRLPTAPPFLLLPLLAAFFRSLAPAFFITTAVETLAIAPALPPVVENSRAAAIRLRGPHPDFGRLPAPPTAAAGPSGAGPRAVTPFGSGSTVAAASAAGAVAAGPGVAAAASCAVGISAGGCSGGVVGAEAAGLGCRSFALPPFAAASTSSAAARKGGASLIDRAGLRGRPQHRRRSASSAVLGHIGAGASELVLLVVITTQPQSIGPRGRAFPEPMGIATECGTVPIDRPLLLLPLCCGLPVSCCCTSVLTNGPCRGQTKSRCLDCPV